MRQFNFLAAIAAVTAVAHGAVNEYTGANNGDWDVAANWSLSHAPTAGDDVRIPQGKAVAASGAVALAANSLTLETGASLTVGSYGMTDVHPQVSIVGDLTLNGTAILHVYPGPVDGTYTFRAGGARVSVGGVATIASGATVYPHVHGPADMYTKGKVYDAALSTGAPVVFDVGELDLQAGGAFNADGLGCGLFNMLPQERPVNFSAGNRMRVGAGYGGVGGHDRDQPAGLPFATYGSEYAPFYPGVAGGTPNSQNIPLGGGAICINVRGEAKIAGALSANGINRAEFCGAGSGGGIWVNAESFSIARTASFQAIGAYAGGNREHQKGGGGGGGRIALSQGLTEAQLAAAYAEEVPSGIVVAPLDNLFPGLVDVSGGLGGCYGYAEGDGGEGTAIYYANAGETLPAEPEYIYLNAANTVRRKFLSSSASAGVATVTWDEEEYLVTASAPHYGTVSAPSQWVKKGFASTAIAATPEDGYRFSYWTGDVTDAERFQNPLVLTGDEPRVIQARFASATPTTYTWNRAPNAYDNWYTPAYWTPNGIPGPEDNVIIAKLNNNISRIFIDDYAKVGSFTAWGDKIRLEIGNTHNHNNNNEKLPTDSAGSPVRKGLTDRRFPIGLDVAGDFAASNNVIIAIGGDRPEGNGLPNTLSFAALRVGGDFIMDNSALLFIYAGATNGVSNSLFDGTGLVKVDGKTTIGNGSVIYPLVNYVTEGHVLFDLQDLEVQYGGAISANGTGGKNLIIQGWQYYTPWPPYDPYNKNWNYKNSYFGGTHGGLGGGTATGSLAPGHCETYGFVNTPINVGMQGGNNNPRGGGVVHINARNVSLAGTISADGLAGNYTGGSAGGSVWINCASFAPAATAVLTVKGGNRTSNSAVGSAGCGGGGRASVTVGFSAEQLEALRTSDAIEGVTIARSALGDVVAGFSAAGGVHGALNGGDGQPGTGVFLANMTGACQLTVSGNPENVGAVTPPYGISAQQEGAVVTLAAPASSLVPGTDDKVRRMCNGWMVTNASGRVIASGEGATGSFTMSEDCWLVWDWTAIEYAVSVEATSGGTARLSPETAWQSDGEEISFVATPDDGYVFLGWTGEGEGVDRLNPSLTVSAAGALSLKAVFATAEAGDKVWVGGTGQKNWFSDSSWNPAGIPGPNSNVRIGTGSAYVYMDCPFVYPIASLTIRGNNALLKIGSNDTGNNVYWMKTEGYDFAGDIIGLKVAGDVVLDAKLSIGGYRQKRDSKLEVGGDLIMTNSTSAFGIYAGMRPEECWGVPSTYRDGAAWVKVAGTLRTANGGWIYPIGDILSGAPVKFDARNLDIGANSGFDASFGGFMYWDNSGKASFCPGAPAYAYMAQYHGASYGGRGGGAYSAETYGVDFAPYMPGSVGGNRKSNYLTLTDRTMTGSGAIRVNAQNARIAGVLKADGYEGYTYGGFSGGAIWLTAKNLVFEETAVLSAKGGDNLKRKNIDGYAGGGGRIAVMAGADEKHMSALYEAEALSGAYVKYDLTADGVQERTPVRGTVSVVAGAVPDNFPQCRGTDGTAVYIEAPRTATKFILW